jgi:ankyrin repeat protein
LYLVCALDLPNDVVKLLLDLYVDAAACRFNLYRPRNEKKSTKAEAATALGHFFEAPVVWKRLPIHLACAYGAPVGVISVLLQSYPPGAISADPHDGSLPLHIACQSTLSLAVVKLLLGFCPEATKAVNLQGRLPMLVAIVNKAPYGVIEALIEEDPLTVTVSDQDGKTPMDYAKQIYGPRHIVVELLAMVHLFIDNKRSENRKRRNVVTCLQFTM